MFTLKSIDLPLSDRLKFTVLRTKTVLADGFEPKQTTIGVKLDGHDNRMSFELNWAVTCEIGRYLYEIEQSQLPKINGPKLNGKNST